MIVVTFTCDGCGATRDLHLTGKHSLDYLGEHFGTPSSEGWGRLFWADLCGSCMKVAADRVFPLAVATPS